MTTPLRELPHRAAFEALGETQVRFECLHRDGEVGKAAVAWLAEQQILRDEAAAAKRDARETKTLRIALAAMVIAAISAHKEIEWLITSSISWLR